MKRVVLDDWLKVLNVDAVTATLFKKLRVVLDGEFAKAHAEDENDTDTSSEFVFELVRDILLLEQ